MPIGGVAIRQRCIPGRSAKDTNADARQLAANQILCCIYLNSGFLSRLDNNPVCEFLMGVAFKAIRVKSNLNVTAPVAAQGVDLHIQAEIGSVFGFLTIESELVTVVLESVGNGNDTFVIAGDAGAVGIGKSGAFFSGLPGGCTQIKTVILLTGNPQIGDFQCMSVGGIAIRQLCVPGRTAVDYKTEAGDLTVFQKIIQTDLDRCFGTGLYGNSTVIVINRAFVGMGI